MDLLNDTPEKVKNEFESVKHWRNSFAAIALITSILSCTFISKYYSLREESTDKFKRDSVAYHSLEQAHLIETAFDQKNKK